VSNEPAIIPDGIFSEETADEVRNFQKSKGLDVTGRVDYITFEALKKENDRVLYEKSEPLQVMNIGNVDLPLSYGDGLLLAPNMLCNRGLRGLHREHPRIT
jgi:peptidoglycan hydrolase-like protein with peptidoglycan-binding domain